MNTHMALKTIVTFLSVAILSACATASTVTSAQYSVADQAPDTIKRSFVDGLYGQVHVRISTPPDGESNKPPLLLLHPTPYSSQFYLPFIEDIGDDRIVIAMDTPGYGDSDRPDNAPSMKDYARNAALVLDALHITEPVNVMGYHTGTLIAVEMSIQEPKNVNKMILAGIPVYPSNQLPALYEKYAKPDVLKKDGSHLTSKWGFATQTMNAGLSLAAAQAHYSDYMQAMPESTQAYYGVFSYPGQERLPLITRPALFVAINGSLKDETLEAQKITPGSNVVYLENVTTGLFDLAHTEMAQITREYLD